MNDFQNSETVLVHHGILGQKWGIRRYQNPDGSLTAAGAKRYGSKENFDKVQDAKRQATEGVKQQKAEAKAAKAKAKVDERVNKEMEKYNKKLHSDEDKPAKEEPKKEEKKSAKDMTDDELKTSIARMRLENDYNNLLPKEKVSKGKEFSDKLVSNLTNAAINAVTDATKQQVTKYLNNQLGNLLGVDEKDAKKITKEATETTETLDKYAKAKRDAEYYKNKKNIAADKKQIDDLERKRKETKREDKAAKKAARDEKKAAKAEKKAQQEASETGKASSKRKTSTSDIDDVIDVEFWDAPASSTSKSTSTYSQIGSSYVSQFLLEDKKR